MLRFAIFYADRQHILYPLLCMHVREIITAHITGNGRHPLKLLPHVHAQGGKVINRVVVVIVVVSTKIALSQYLGT